MSLDVNLMVTQPVSIYADNITHNLGEMARQVVVNYGDFDEALTLYEVLWRPDEQGFAEAGDIVDFLYQGWRELVANPDRYRQYNPANGWGSYEGLVAFVKNYHDACVENPAAQLSVCR